MNRCTCENGRLVTKLNTLLAQAKYCNYELEEENLQLREEIHGLVEELARYERAFAALSPPDAPIGCPFRRNLEGKIVTLVGGIEGLECHYRQVIESAGGRFRRHDGVAGGCEQALEDCISGSDLVVCPLEVNSAGAAKSVKRICLSRGVRCCFPASPSIAGLRRALEEHYSDRAVA